MTQPNEQFIATVDVRTLHNLNWPIIRLLDRSFVERLELRQYKRKLLSSGRWERIRAVPQTDRPYLFDVHGLPALRRDANKTEDRVPYPLF